MNDSAATLIDELRLLYNQLLAAVEELHGGALRATQRAVMEFLHRGGPATVPTVARARGVTRQHIQLIVNELEVLGWAAPAPNPAHRRSPLYSLTDSGAATIAAVLAREVAYLDSRLGDVDPSELYAAARTLGRVRERI